MAKSDISVFRIGEKATSLCENYCFSPWSKEHRSCIIGVLCESAPRFTCREVRCASQVDSGFIDERVPQRQLTKSETTKSGPLERSLGSQNELHRNNRAPPKGLREVPPSP